MKEKYSEYLRLGIAFIKQQKLLTGVIALIGIMLIFVVSGSVVGKNAENKSINNNTYPRSGDLTAQQSPQGSVQAPANSTVAPTDAPLTTKFIYVIQSFFKPGQNSGQGGGLGSLGNSRGGTNNISQGQDQQQGQESNTSYPPGNSGGGGDSGGGGQSGSGGSQQQANPAVPTPTPITDIQIKFITENGEYWTYVPPAIPPIDTTWVKYINYQDHYSIEYPADWIVSKTNYNGHEGITLYMPGDTGNIDRPSIAFVGWKMDYLTSMASYTGPIILKGTPGTIYTNGPFGISSVASVFQYQYGYFALGSSTSNDIFMYVFDHMLRSIEFNIN